DAVSVPGIDAWVYSRPVGGQSSGGDIHYVSTCGGGKIARFAVADVSGHGVAVSELATQLRKLMRAHINTVDQTRFIRVLNRAFTALASDGKFATALLATYFAPTAHLITCNAGHPPPLWYRSADQTWRSLEVCARSSTPWHIGQRERTGRRWLVSEGGLVELIGLPGGGQ
ncbi:MAG: SpoIIE family protein phosphatase, partial [bacterium]|nr:SpoIIE family protein phosphatase [bacterium]